MQQHAAHPVTQHHINLAHRKVNQLCTTCYNCYFAAQAIGCNDLASQLSSTRGGIHGIHVLGTRLRITTQEDNNMS